MVENSNNNGNLSSLKNNVEFFYHRCAPNKVVRLIKRKFGVIGYAFYYQLRELLGDAKHHNYVLKNELDWQDFLTIMEMDEDKANEIIEFLIKVEELDKKLWENEKRLYSQNFVDRLAPVYAKRKSEMPYKYSFRDGNTQSKVKDSKAKNSKEEKTIVDESGRTQGGVDLERLKDKYKNVDIDLDKSYKKFRLHQQSSNRKYADENAGFEYWVLNDIENGRHHKELTDEEFEKRLMARRAFRKSH